MILDIANPLQPEKDLLTSAIGDCDRLLVQPSNTNVFAYVSDGGALAVMDNTSASNPVLRQVLLPQSHNHEEAHSLTLLNNSRILR